ncbi:MAG: cation:proton antiporter, partial [Myxococcales bacterium]|nr:cation:proton antiporter [Myxococcales bacterium]
AAAPALLLILLGIGTKTLGGFLAGRSAGHRREQALVVGLSLIPKGEFSIVLAGLAALATQPGSKLQAVTGVYVFVLSILGPIAMREADRLRQAAFGTQRAAPGAEPAGSVPSVVPEPGSSSEDPP